ncbi:MAG: hypothetical protein M3Y52_03985 [Actinomycetota bacterium]|nr:hypothetical protein [Actinomycetota bacterium]
MSTDETADPGESIESTDAAARPAAEPDGAEATAATRAELRDIETAPLAERAARYQELADRLRSELEHSDPSRGAS